MGQRVVEEVTRRVYQRMHISHGWDLLIWCRIRDEGLDNVVYEQILCQKTFGQALMSRLKYDDYQAFLVGARFVECLADWLQQFAPEEREIAYSFVRRNLVYIGATEIQHLVELVVPEVVQRRLLSAIATRLQIPTYLVWSQPEATTAYERLLRKTLFLGLSDGARIDAFRRANAGIISNEQVVVALW